MADDVGGRTISKAEALQYLQSVTGQSFSDLRDPAISSALAAANMAAGGTGGDGAGSCVYDTDEGRVCHDNVTQEQCEVGLLGRWSGLLSCAFRQGELEQRYRPVGGAEAVESVPTPPEAVPTRTPQRRAAKPAKKKPAKKRAAPRVAKRAAKRPAAAASRTKAKKKAAAKAKPKRRAAKAAAKKTPKRPAKKARRR
jgi:hypothetical protein